MIQRDYLIIGSGIGGASACEGVRKYDKRGSVTLVGAEVSYPYKRWMLSKDFLREKIRRRRNSPCSTSPGATAIKSRRDWGQS